jgi:hypothetical protein
VRRVRLQTAKRTPIDITAVSCDQAVVEAKVVEDTSSAAKNAKFVEVSLKNGVTVGETSAKLQITTSVAGAEQITIPIRVLTGGKVVGSTAGGEGG